MASYRFVTRWRIPAPRESVWRVLADGAGYGEWWPGFAGYRDLTPGVVGVGSASERVVRGPLPYALRYVAAVTRFDPPAEMAYDASGDLNGRGRFVLEEKDGGTEVVFYWDVSTSGFRLNLLAPLFYGLFAWNHNVVMARGERGLGAHLARRPEAAAGPQPS